MNKNITCQVCGAPLKGKQTMYCSLACKNQKHQCYKAQKARGLRRKILLAKKLGGICSVCGYSKNLAALTFHHKKPENKSFKLDMRSLSNRKQYKIDSEVKKCILVCHNCHAEIHNPQHNLDSII